VGAVVSGGLRDGWGDGVLLALVPFVLLAVLAVTGVPSVALGLLGAGVYLGYSLRVLLECVRDFRAARDRVGGDRS
jgi:hypothetical protein